LNPISMTASATAGHGRNCRVATNAASTVPSAWLAADVNGRTLGMIQFRITLIPAATGRVQSSGNCAIQFHLAPATTHRRIAPGTANARMAAGENKFAM
jgi:hypothetical protein